MSEDEQINQIVGTLRAGLKPGVIVDDDAKADRYEQKILAAIPGLKVKFRGPLNVGRNEILLVFKLTKKVDPSNN